MYLVSYTLCSEALCMLGHSADFFFAGPKNLGQFLDRISLLKNCFLVMLSSKNH